ncbi:MAG: inositol monophosphatase family protein [Nitrospirota bacterium]|jgi:myo-inositol-1(or 4)-monophosphatase
MGEGEFLETAFRAARNAAGVILGNLGSLSRDDIDSKQASDFVTRVDRESEKTIVETIGASFPDHTFLAEESIKDADNRYRWIIDPLDGTTNFIHQYPMFSVSIALEAEGEVVLGVVLDPLRDELFHAEKGGGAFLNGKPLSVSSVESPGGSLIATGFPFRNKGMTGLYLEAFKRVFLASGDLRRAGSAALDLCHLAAGRCEGFFELGLSAWDVAAGGLMIKEAGGLITDFSGGDDYLATGNVVAGNPPTHGLLLKIIRETFKGVIDR